jgi:uncharacterized protein YfaS (alpha-2-macroglobulin family)
MAGKDRAEARGLWKIERLLIPFASRGRVESSKDFPADLEAAIGLLLRWKGTFLGPASARAAYEAAVLLRLAGRPAESAALCREVVGDPSSLLSRKASKLLADIEMPSLSLTAASVPPPGIGSLEVSVKNLRSVHMRLYRTSPAELRKGQPDRWSHGWTALRRPEEGLIKSFAARTPTHAWEVGVGTASPYLLTTIPADPPALEPGLYLALAGSDADFKPGATMMQAAVLNITELFLAVTEGPQGPEREFILDPAMASATVRTAGFHVYAFDGRTGDPRAAHVSAYRQARWSDWTLEESDLDDSGRGKAVVSLNLSDMEPSSYSFDPLASLRGSYALLAYPSSLHFSGRAPYLVELETDRPIYRPGQEVRVKATALTRLPRGWKSYDGASRLVLDAMDANGQNFFKKTLTLNAMGSASASFVIPTGRLLGRFSITAAITERGRVRQGWGSFQVEEYKRPEFEVTLKESSGPWKYGQAVTVTGTSRYYFGSPVSDASVDLKVYREPFVPWWCWWWRGWGAGRGRELVHSRVAKTDACGGFSLTFTPTPPADAGSAPLPSRFTVEAASRDQGGRTITAQRSFKAGATAYLVSLTPSAGFFTSRTKGSVEAKLLTLDETPASGEVSFTLHSVDGGPRQAVGRPAWDGSFQDEVSLEEAFAAAPNGPEIRRGRLAVGPGKPGRIGLGTLAEGVYRLTVRARDPWGGENEASIILLGAGSSSRPLIDLPGVAIPEHSSYLPGEKARVLMGSTRLKGALFVEIWGGPFLLEKRVLDKGGVRVIDVPVTHDHKGGFWVRWFSARDFRIETGQAGIEVPWKDKRLAISLKGTKALKPGAKAIWRLAVSDAGGRPASGEATVRVFDRSLEHYMAAEKPWGLGLYPKRTPPSNGQGSLFQPGIGSVAVTEGWIKKLLDAFREAVSEPVLPELRLNGSRVHGRRTFGRSKMKSMSAPTEDGSADMRLEEKSFAMADMAAALAGGNDVAAVRASGGSAAAPPVVAVRSDFSETALFQPHLKVMAGSGATTFTAPERLTGWKIQASVLTRDAKVGVLEDEAVTKKDLMARLELPRFLREGDSGTVKILINNETASELSGEAFLVVDEDGKPAGEVLGLDSGALSKPFTVKPHGTAALSWSVKAPKRLASLKLRAIGRAGPLADAEEKDLSILPSRQRLIETAFAALDGEVKAGLELPSFKEDDPTRENESMTLQVDPQLALTVLNSLPFLIRYPFECVEQTLNRFVPLAIVNAFYKKHPALSEAAAKLSKRDTLTPAWDRSDPRRLTELMESPWQQVSQGRRSAFPLIDLFDPKNVSKELADSSEKLLRAQNSDGAFPWFPGGRSDPYITLLVLAGWAEAQRYGVDIPKDTAARALSYIQSEIPRRLEGSLKPDESLVSTLLYAAYVVTSFEKGTGDTAALWKLAKTWADFADLHKTAMTPMGKALAAHVYWRLGERAKGDQYLTTAMDGAREDPIAGVYWTPEKLSWLWYNDSVETHAFLLRTLLLIRPKDPRITGMVKWLLFNRKGNEWKSTKASAAAIYSLLDVLKTRDALDRGDSYMVRWGPDTYAASVSPMDWLAKPLVWTEKGMDIVPGRGAVSIQKTGPGLGFASLTWIYTTDRPAKASGPSLLQVSRRFFLRVQDGAGFTLKPLQSGDAVRVGDEIEVKLSVSSRSQFEYLHLKDPKAAGLEASGLLSGWKWDRLARYEEPRDSLTNFFLDWIPHGEYEFGYRLRPTLPGSYRVAAAVLQSMYAPEMAAHSDGFLLNVDP